jgi:hypothetical protein
MISVIMLNVVMLSVVAAFQMLARDINSSLFGLFVSDEVKKFYNIDSWWPIEVSQNLGG